MPKSKARKLKDEHRAFLVRELACYSTPKEAAESLKEKYGIEITPQAAETYDPGKSAGSKKWRPLFDACRKRFLENIEESVPIANKAVRLAKIQKAARFFEDRKNYMGVLDALERAAKEVGNVHTNRRELTGKDGKAMQFEDVSTMTPEQVDAELAAHLKNPEMRKFLAGLGLSAVEGSETKQ